MSPVPPHQELSAAERLNQTLCSQLAEYSVPGVLEYIQVKDKHNKLQCSLRTWERKMELAEVKLYYMISTDTACYTTQ